MTNLLRASKALVAVAAILVAMAAVGCQAHGYLEFPLSRARVLGQPEWIAAGGNGLGTPHRTYSSGGLLNDQADVCGDPHQDIGDLNVRGQPRTIQATFSSGSIITVRTKLTVNHGGWIGIRLCPSTRTNPTHECFANHILTNADTGFQRWWITSGSYGVVQTYTTRWQLPSGVACNDGCILQMVYRTANSCIDPCSSAECGPNYSARNNLVTNQYGLSHCASIATTMVGAGQTPRTEIFRDCADIQITGGGTVVTPTSSPPPPAVNPTNPAPSGGGGGSCTSPSASTFCAGKAPGFYGDKCKSCTWFYWCYSGGSVYQQCGAGTAMDSRGTATGCNWPASIVC